jgi:hypothetical protein
VVRKKLAKMLLKHITPAACAPLEWSRRRNVKGVAMPALVMGFRVLTAIRFRKIKDNLRICP